jgi:hypothetical protein
VANVIYHDNCGVRAAGRSSGRFRRRDEFSGFRGHKTFYRAAVLIIIKANSSGK